MTHTPKRIEPLDTEKRLTSTEMGLVINQLVAAHNSRLEEGEKQQCPLRVHPYGRGDDIPLCPKYMCSHILLPDEKICPCHKPADEEEDTPAKPPVVEELPPKGLDYPDTPAPAEWEVEKLAAELHEIYQKEARRQGDIRHADSYVDLPENIKEFDRVLARFIHELFAKEREVLRGKVEGMKIDKPFSTHIFAWNDAIGSVLKLFD